MMGENSPLYQEFKVTDPIKEAKEISGIYAYLGNQFAQKYAAKKALQAERFLFYKTPEEDGKRVTDETAESKMNSVPAVQMAVQEVEILERLLKALEIKARMIEVLLRGEQKEQSLS